MIGANSMETQTNLYLNHMLPRLRGGAKMIVVDPRRTLTVHSSEQYAGAKNVLHLAINEGKDMAQFNAILTHVVDQGWTDDGFTVASTFQGGEAVAQDSAHPAGPGSLDYAMQACRTSVAEAAANAPTPMKRASSGAMTPTARSAPW